MSDFDLGEGSLVSYLHTSCFFCMHAVDWPRWRQMTSESPLRLLDYYSMWLLQKVITKDDCSSDDQRARL